MAYTNVQSAIDLASQWKNLKTFKLDVQGAAQAFMFTCGHGDGFHQEWNAEDGRKPFSYDSTAGMWRKYTGLDGWEDKTSILPEMTEIMAILCAHAAIEIADRGTKPEDRPDPADYNIDPDTGEPRTVHQQEVKRKFEDKQAAKIDEQYRKLRQRFLGTNVGKAVDVAQALMSVSHWNVDDNRIGLPRCETLHITPKGKVIGVNVDGQLPTQYITRTLAAKPGEKSELWESFVLDACDGDKEMVDALQVWTASAMLVGNPEHRTHILYGDGATGKSTFLKVVQTAMGDYAGTARASLFTSEKDSHPAELLPFVNRRMVILPELPKGALRSDILKAVTGGDSISVREMRRNPRTETPQATLFFSCNELPSIEMVDEAIKRRLLVWPFDKKPDVIDVQLGHKLVLPTNMAGVVTWLCDGLRQVLKLRANDTPLPIPAKVRNTTEDYFDEVDQIGVWRDACLAETGEAPSKQLYDSYKGYCKYNNRDPLSDRSFYLWMSRNYEKRRVRTGSLYPVMVK